MGFNSAFKVLRMLQAWCRSLRMEILLWRNGLMLMKGKDRDTRLKKLRKNNVYKAIYFQLHTSKNEFQTPELLSTLYVDRNPLFPFVWTFYVCTATGHRLVCWIFSACLMAISKGTFCWHCKMAGKVLRRAKRGEILSITFCSLFYLALPCRTLPP